jgi:hypothetical protein
MGSIYFLNGFGTERGRREKEGASVYSLYYPY